MLFTSDNGGALNVNLTESIAAQQAGLAINGRLKGDKGSIWEGGFREPYLLRWPGHVPADTVCDDIVSLSDTLATLAGILHVPLAPEAAEDSLDVSASWFGTTNGKPPRDSIVYQGYLSSGSSYAVRRGPWKFIERENPPPFPARNKQMEQQLAGFRARGPQHDQLFNLADDPAEMHDVAAAHRSWCENFAGCCRCARARGDAGRGGGRWRSDWREIFKVKKVLRCLRRVATPRRAVAATAACRWELSITFGASKVAR